VNTDQSATPAFSLIIEPRHAEKNYWRDVWKFREIALFLAWRDLLVRYKQTLLGVAWSMIRPLFTMIAFTIVFDKIAKLPDSGVPYAILVLSGLLPWQFFATSLTENSNSLIANSNLVSKVFFPRILVPLSSMAIPLMDFFISFLMLLGIMGWFHFMPSPRMVFLPAFLLLAFFLSLGFGLWFCALNVRYRDFKYLVPFAVQVGIYVSPVGFTSYVVPEQWRLLYSVCNPMVGVIDGFRWSLIGGPDLNVPSTLASTFFATVLMATGTWYFRKVESTFADYI
jgi:lipopolysaccharide transport system permease protein